MINVTTIFFMWSFELQVIARANFWTEFFTLCLLTFPICARFCLLLNFCWFGGCYTDLDFDTKCLLNFETTWRSSRTWSADRSHRSLICSSHGVTDNRLCRCKMALLINSSSDFSLAYDLYSYGLRTRQVQSRFSGSCINQVGKLLSLCISRISRP